MILNAPHLTMPILISVENGCQRFYLSLTGFLWTGMQATEYIADNTVISRCFP